MTTDPPGRGVATDRTATASGSESLYRRHYARFLVVALSTLTLLAILGYPATVRLVGQDGVGAMFVALLVAFLASAAGTVPIYLARGRPATEVMPAQLGAMAVRLVVILVLGTAIALGSGLATKPFLLWLVLAHAALLVADTLFARALVMASPPSR